ncbi:MAG: hypothetical protein JWO82_4229 [Akkermansiaceae bacterium]|nr:hypothetical protein [Akkermansiaceae bacterium]
MKAFLVFLAVAAGVNSILYAAALMPLPSIGCALICAAILAPKQKGPVR